LPNGKVFVETVNAGQELIVAKVILAELAEGVAHGLQIRLSSRAGALADRFTLSR
jgi:hypothetical protein